MREKYLPIGTIVLLKGGKKRAMITGFCSVAQENQEKVYDYSGCVYPEGSLSSHQVCLFDHDQIEKIFFVGYEDEEEIMFKQKLNQIVKAIEANKQNNFKQQLQSSIKKNEELKKLQKDFENGDISIEEMTKKQIEELDELYSIQIREAKRRLEAKKEKLKNKTNLVNSYYKKIIEENKKK